FLVHEQRFDVVTVPLARLAEAVDELTDVVAFSAVQSSNGAVADIEAVLRAAAANEALTIVDATQACGWLPLDASRFDALVCSSYKWLLAPRGTALMTASERLLDRTEPLLSGWYAGDDPYRSYYGRPRRLAPRVVPPLQHDGRRRRRPRRADGLTLGARLCPGEKRGPGDHRGEGQQAQGPGRPARNRLREDERPGGDRKRVHRERRDAG